MAIIPLPYGTGHIRLDTRDHPYLTVLQAGHPRVLADSLAAVRDGPFEPLAMDNIPVLPQGSRIQTRNAPLEEASHPVYLPLRNRQKMRALILCGKSQLKGQARCRDHGHVFGVVPAKALKGNGVACGTGTGHTHGLHCGNKGAAAACQIRSLDQSRHLLQRCSHKAVARRVHHHVLKDAGNLALG